MAADVIINDGCIVYLYLYAYLSMYVCMRMLMCMCTCMCMCMCTRVYATIVLVIVMIICDRDSHGGQGDHGSGVLGGEGVRPATFREGAIDYNIIDR